MRITTLFLAALPAMAHMVSISTGEIQINGATAVYRMRMPLYEVAHLKNPERDLPASVQFSAGGKAAVAGKSSCQKVEAESALQCETELKFSEEVDVLEARSSLHSVTVPNHVHVLRAVRGETSDQAVLDLSFPSATLRFRPPTAWELAWQQGLAGALRAGGGLAQLLFLVALAVAARSRRELIALTVAFIAGEAISAAVVPAIAWQPAPRFVEAACALTIAYLAVETFFLPDEGKRWLVVGVLGLLHGLYLALFLSETGHHAVYVVAGAALAEIALIALLWWLLHRVKTSLPSLQPVRVLSALLMVTGMAWFLFRMKG